MDTSPAGLAAAALILLWLGFWVPQQLRRRQQLAEARTSDRFSGGLRVLAVADGTRKGRAMREPRTNGVTGGGTSPHPAPSATRPPAPGRPSSRQRPSPSPTTPGRLAVLEERAARARRRLVVTLALLVLTAAAWTAVGLGYVSWPVAAVPSALLLMVLLLGRLAVRTARRADARWRAERRARQQEATQQRTLAHGGPYAPRNRARVTGRAVHPSDTSTQMIPRVQADSAPPARARASSSPAQDAAPERADDAEPERADHGGFALGDAARPDRAAGPAPEPTADRTPEQRDRGASGGTPWRVGGEPWEPVPVPLPTYVTKAEAPRRMQETTVPVQPTRDDDAALRSDAADTAGSDGGAPAGEATPERAAVAATTPEPTAGDEPRPRTETLGLPLEQILARRRAAG